MPSSSSSSSSTTLSSSSLILLKILITQLVWIGLATLLFIGPTSLTNGQQTTTFTTSTRSNSPPFDYASLFRNYEQSKNNQNNNHGLRNFFNSTLRELRNNFQQPFVIRNLTRTISNLISVKPKQSLQNNQNINHEVNGNIINSNQEFIENTPSERFKESINEDTNSINGHEDFDDNRGEESKYNSDKMSKDVKSDREGYSNNYNNGYDQYDNEREQFDKNGQYGQSEVSNTYESMPVNGNQMQSQQFMPQSAQFMSAPGPPTQFVSSHVPAAFVSSQPPAQFIAAQGPAAFSVSTQPQFLSASQGPHQHFMSVQGPPQFVSSQQPQQPQFLSTQFSGSGSQDYPQQQPQQVVVNQPVQRIIEQVPMPYEVHHTVDRPVPVPVHIVREVPQPVPVDRIVHVDRPVPYPVVQQVPVPEPVAVPVNRYVPVPHPVEVIRHVGVPQPYPVVQRVMVDRPVFIDRAVPVPVQQSIRLTPVPIMNRGIRVESVMWRPRQMLSNFNGRFGRMLQSNFRNVGGGGGGALFANGGSYKK